MFSDDEKYQRLRESMVQEQLRARDIRDTKVLDAMMRVPRHVFVLPQDRESAYDDCPLPIGFGQTISQPYIVAFMAQALRLQPQDKVLEIGTGSGYAAAVMAELAGAVVTLEIVKELYERSSRLLARLNYKNVVCRLTDGYFGAPDQAPFTKIILTAAPDRVPQSLLDQLAVGGLLIAPVGPIKLFQRLVLYEKLDRERYKEAELMGVSFVEMVHGAAE